MSDEHLRAQTLVGNGLPDKAIDIADLTEKLTDAILNDLNGFGSKWIIAQAIRRTLVAHFNDPAHRRGLDGEIR